MFHKSSKYLFKTIIQGCRYNFFNENNPSTQLRNCIQQLLTQKNRINFLTNINYDQHVDTLKSFGWSIKQINNMIELQQVDNSYQISIVLNTRLPLRQTWNNISFKREKEYLQITVYLKKNRMDKWLIADYLIQKSDHFLLNVQFMKDIGKEKIQRIFRCNEISNYDGFYLNSLKNKIQTNIQQQLQKLGLNKKLFKTIYQFNKTIQQKKHIQWLQNLESII